MRIESFKYEGITCSLTYFTDYITVAVGNKTSTCYTRKEALRFIEKTVDGIKRFTN